MESGYISIDNNIFQTLLAISADEQRKGLMYEPWPPPVMSFIYDRPTINKFWMHNTQSPLDILFCCNGKITQIHAGEPFSTKIIGDDKYSDLIIELPFGTAKTSNIKIHSIVELIKPNRRQLQKIIAEKCHGIIKI